MGAETVAATLQRLTELATRAVEPADFAGITLDAPRGPVTAFFTDPEAPEIDHVQYQAGAGPCLEAMERNAVFRVDSTEDDDRWKEFAEGARRHGILSTLSMPMSVTAGSAVGAINFYSRRRAAFDGAAEERAAAFADQAAVVLAHAQPARPGEELSPQMRRALASRAVVDKAKVIVMGKAGCNADQAFEMLRRASRQANTNLSDTARQIVERARRGDDD